mmetsp:Transcript_60796/g.131899  ORF Transcript_60796/g.131899 Transcript_60796/m.131899 type:complete len:326 (-) Transcript_60796:314-1291(-)
MAPKRVPSRGPAAKGKAKAKAKAVEDPRAALEKEAEEVFEQSEPQGKLDGTLKLAQFAEVVRSMNRRLLMLWGDDPMKVITEEWSKSGGAAKRELPLAEFKAWYPSFAEAAKSQQMEKLAAKEAEAAAAEARKAELFNGDGVWKFSMKDLHLALGEAQKRGKTPLILDNTEGQRVEAFFAYSDSYIIECKKMIMGKAKEGKSPEEVLDEERRRFISGQCFKQGRTVVFRLANTACDLLGMFNSEAFPSVALLDAQKVAVAKETGAESSEFVKMAVGRDEELEMACGIHERFNVIVVSQFKPEEYEEFLAASLPLHLMQPMLPSTD